MFTISNCRKALMSACLILLMPQSGLCADSESKELATNTEPTTTSQSEKYNVKDFESVDIGVIKATKDSAKATVNNMVLLKEHIAQAQSNEIDNTKITVNTPDPKATKNAVTDNTQTESPKINKDEEIRLLKEQLAKQQQQIDELRKLVETTIAAKKANSGEESGNAVALDTDTKSETSANDNEEETVDPGPTPPKAEEAPSEVSASASGQQPSMNPNISLVLLGGGKLGGYEDDPDKNTFFLQEAELAISAPVDPKTKVDACIAFPKDESPEIEEAIITYSGMGSGLELKGGLLRNDFGRINTLHSHALPQIDRPLPVSQFFGEEGLRSPGVEVSWLAPLPWYSKLTAEVTSRYGEHHDHAEGEEAEEEFALFPKGGKNNPIITARWENMADLNEDTTLMLGLSHASSSIDDGTIRDSAVYGADLTLKWKPTKEEYRDFIWQTEYMAGKQNYVEPEKDSKSLNGWYTYVSSRLNRNIRIGARYDKSDVPTVENGSQQRYSAILEYIANEWNSIRLQYNHNDPNYGKSWDECLLQWNVVIGPHGAHKY